MTNPASLSIAGSTTVRGGGANPAVAVVSVLPPILTVPLGTLLGFPTVQRLDPIDLSSMGLFGMRVEQFRALADIVEAQPQKLPPAPLQDQVFYVEKLLQLDPRMALRGRMLLFVAGDLMANSGNDSDFAGIVVVQGNAVLRGPFRFKGQMLVAGTLDMLGTPDAPVDLSYDGPTVAALTQALSKYRKVNEVRPSGKAGAFTPIDAYDAVVK